MAKRVLAIGVGGSGKAALTILKERAEETYGSMPDNLVLLSLDTDSLRDVDRFAGVRLSPQFDARRRLPEFQQIVSPGGITMDTIFADINSGRTRAWFEWLEHEKLDRILSPEEREIRGGAQQRRPIGRTALFLRYNNPIYQSIHNSIARMYGNPDDDGAQPVNQAEIEKGKRLVFLVGSVAGGTGSGMLIDVANLVRHAIISNQNWQSVSVSAVIVLPDAFSSYTTFMNDPTNLKPNSYAALREFDRFSRTHSSFLPYMIRYADNYQGITWSTSQLVDHCYLVDTASRSAVQDFNLSGDPKRGVFPVVADFLMAHVDSSLGDALATLRSNAGQHYDRAGGRMYSSFNVMTYLFPVNDVISSFSYRFLRELLAREFLPIVEERRSAALRQETIGKVETTFTASTVLGQNNPTIVQKSIVATRRVEPETPDISWAGLFGLISLSDSGFAEDYQYLQNSLEYLESGLALSRDGDYKRENFDDGAARLFNFTDQYLDDYVGPQIDPMDPDSRTGGYWDQVLQKYREALRIRFAQVLDAQIIETMNQRDDNKILLPIRLPSARDLVNVLKGYFVQFKVLLQQDWQRQAVETQLRQISEEVRSSIAWVNETRTGRYFPPFLTDPRKAQESFVSQVVDYMRLLLHRRIYHVVLDVLDSLGAADQDRDGQESIVELARNELESWEHTFRDVDQLLVEGLRQHNANREEKRSVKVRRYLTDPEFEDQLYKHPKHAPMVAMRIMGQVGNQKGIEFKRRDELHPLKFKLFTTWGEEASGAEEIARTCLAGAREVFGVVRSNVTVAERLDVEFRGHAPLANRALEIAEPFLRYNPAKNDGAMFAERYISFNVDKAQEDRARQMLSDAGRILGDQGYNVDPSAESVVACTVVQISRGVRLEAVEPYVQSEPEYRAKVDRGRESLHLFPEEQYATEMERAIPTLAETANPKRALAPEVVIAMGDPNKFRAFTLACAYGLVEQGVFTDIDTGQESVEIYLRLTPEHKLPLSQSRAVAGQEANFAQMPAQERIARLYLNALQNFMLKLLEPQGFNMNLVQQTLGELARRGIPLAGIENPLTLTLREVNKAIQDKVKPMGDSILGGDPKKFDAQNARARSILLSEFVRNTLDGFKRSQDTRIKDMGTVMHLVLNSEIDSLRQRANQGN